jgi:uncharacterized membrane protein
MKALKNLFTILFGAGLVGIVALFLHVEWMFVNGSFANFFKPLVQVFVVGSMLILPLFWVLLAIFVLGYFGRRAIRKRMDRTVVE